MASPGVTGATLQTTPHTGTETHERGLKMRNLIAQLRTLAERENGQTMAEYSIVLAVITVAAVAALVVLGSNISDALNAVAVLV
jgi:Flp pilus assembly pilin Flp